MKFTESEVEEAALGWFSDLKYTVLHGPEIAPGELLAERSGYETVILEKRLRDALARLNPNLPAEAIDEALRRLTRADHPGLLDNNHQFHSYLTEGVPVEYQADGRNIHDYARIVDFDHPTENDFTAINQFTVIENRRNRRPDIIIFVNGLPLAVLELKNPANENATAKEAFKQFQTYKAEIPSLFAYNEVLVASDGIDARAGTLTSDWERFMPWRTVDGAELSPTATPQLEVMLKGMFDKSRFLDLIRHFIVFEKTRTGAASAKKMAAYHQFHAVHKAVEATVKAIKGDKRIGIVWHTQGSGKSLTMGFYSGKIIQRQEMANPTLIVLTDRNDLDDQLFQTFSACSELLRQTPAQAEDRAQLRDLLKTASGGVVFTTIQKFLPEEKGDRYPLLSDRRNIVVIADEAHRSQYDFIDGFAKHMRDALPNASFIGFTATPIESADKSTPAVFGDYIDIYDVHQAIEDKATVPIYYEARLAKLELKASEKPKIDPQFEEVTEGEEESARRKLKSKWARLESLVGADKRIGQVAQDIVDHFEKRLEVLEGKGIVVCMSRRICVELYNAIVKIRPQWHQADDDKGLLKVVMTGSATDPVDWQQHIRDKARRHKLGDIFKDPSAPFKLVRGMPQKNLAMEVLKKLLNDSIKLRSQKFLVQSRSFAEMLEETIRKYHNRAIEAAAVIEELIRLAKEMRQAHKRGEKMGLSEDELAFYDALETNNSAVKVLGDGTLRDIAREIVETVRGNVSIDWTVKESVRAKLRALVKRVLRKHGYPPDKQEKATQTVLEQAELICKDWAS